ncbi:MAG TPA: methyltransferase domain-containing protein [Acidimicrobiales bacterium]|nr:methyltransferase domain-containing protein [Acidimicrobiales bacterium]
MSTGRSASANIARQQRFWTRRAAEWDHGAANNPGLVEVVTRVLEEAAPEPGMKAIDLGCGSGQLTITLARSVDTVIGVDISQRMIDLLASNAKEAGVANIEGRATPIEHLKVDAGSIDLIVSNYALHHLRDPDKSVAIDKAAGWLKPGGRLVIGDMMFGRGGEARDREIIASKVQMMVRKGPKGWWRIAKNGWRFLMRSQERPVSMAAWKRMFEQAGLVDVREIPVVNEAAVVVGTKPREDAA